MFFDTWRKWLNRIFRILRLRRTPYRRSTHPRFEPEWLVLEDRLAPSVTVNVNTADDTHAVAPLVSALDAGNHISLRSAIEFADKQASSAASPNIINVPAGTYDLLGMNGSLALGNSPNLGTKIVGAGAASTFIERGTGQSNFQIFNLDPHAFGRTNITIQDVTIAHGRDVGQSGGGGIVDGGASSPNPNDNLTLTNVTFNDNFAAGVVANVPGGGAVSVTGGVLSITNCTFTNSSAGNSAGGAVWYSSNYLGVGGTNSLTVTNCTFTNNMGATGAPATLGGGAIFADMGAFTANITKSLFKGNQVTGGNAGGGGAIYAKSGTINTNQCNFEGNQITVAGAGQNAGGAIFSQGSLTAQFNRFFNNMTMKANAGNDVWIDLPSTFNIDNNWWGQNAGPSAVQARSGPIPNVAITPGDWLTLINNAATSPIFSSGHAAPNATVLNAGINGLHSGGTTAAANLVGLPSFPNPTLGNIYSSLVLGTLSGSSTQLVNGFASATFTAGAMGGMGSALATIDNQAVTTTFAIDQMPQVTTQPSGVNTQVGQMATFTAAVTNGFPAPTTQWQLDIGSGFTNLSNGNVGGVTYSGVTTNTLVISNVTSALAGSHYRVVFSNAAGDAFSNSAPLIVAAPPTIGATFGAATIPVTGTTSLSFTLTNPNATVALSGIGFNLALPAGLVVATPNGVSGGVGAGTITAVAGSSTISLSGGTLAAAGSASFSVNVTGTTAGVKSATTSAVTSTQGGTGGTATASVTVVAPPTIADSFGASTIPVTGATSLSFSLTNPNATVALTGIGFNLALPAGLVVATPNGVSGSVGAGTITAVAGSGTISLSGGTLVVAGSASFRVNVTGTTAGVKSTTTSAVTSTQGGTGGTATASVTVVAPPTIADSFGAATIALNGTTSLSFTFTNPNQTVGLSGIGFNLALPTGLVVATPNGVSGSVGTGTITAVAGSSTISLSGGTLAAASSASFSVNVTGTTAGVKSTTTSAVTSTQGGTGGTATASVTVVAPPTISATFGAASIPVNGSTSLTFTFTNPNATVGLSGIGFSLALPAGLVVATPNGVSGTLAAGTITAVAGSSTISLSGSTLAAGGSAFFRVNVTGTTAGAKNVTTSTVTSTQGGTGGMATASVTVVAPPTIAASFGAATIALNGTTSLSFTFTNPNQTVGLGGIGFNLALPAGLVVATPNGVSGSVGAGTIAAVAGSSTISLSGGTLVVAGSASFSVNVTGTTAGVKSATTSAVTSTQGGTGGTATASVTVLAPPTIAASFGAATIALNGTTSLSFTFTNPNGTVGLSGIGFNLALPTGLVVATPNGVSGSVGTGTITAVAGSSTISLLGGTLAAAGSASFSVNVTGTTTGVKNTTTSAVTSTQGGTGGTATASVAVVAPPTISATFGAAGVPLNGSTTLRFTITNPATNTVALSGVAFSDTLPAGLVVATPNGLTGTFGGGTVTAVAGSSSVSLAGATIAAGGSITFSVNVTGTMAGVKSTTTSAVTSTQGGTGGTATASVTVVAPPTIAASFGAATIALNGTTSLSFTFTNPNGTVGLGGIGFNLALPAGLRVATPNGVSGSIGAGTITAVAGSSTISLSGGTLVVAGSASFSVNVTGTTAGVKSATTSAVTSQGGAGGTATASVTVVAPPTIAASFGTASIGLNGTTSLTFSFTNPNSALGLTGIGFSLALPAGLVVANPNGVSGTLSAGTITAVAGSSTISLSGGTLAAAGSASFSVNVTGTTAGVKSTTTSAVTSTQGGTGGTATASVTVLAPPMVTTSTAALPANATSIIINGLGFSATPASNTVVFNDGAVGNVTTASATSLTVAFTTRPISAGSLTAIVTSNGMSSGAAVQVATVTPALTMSTAPLPASAASIIINGFAFDAMAANNTVAFNDGAIGTVTTASATSLSVTFTTKPISAGSLTAVITTNGVSSGAPVQVATVSPVVTSGAANLAANATSIIINGFGFSATPGSNAVVFNDGAIGNVTAASATSLTVTFTTKPANAGSLTAIVTANGVGSGAAVQVATVMPVVTMSTAALPANATSIIINGFGFAAAPASNTVVFNDGAVGNVTTASATSLTVTFTTKPTNVGSLTAVVTSSGVSSGAAVQVATVTPVVTVSTAALLANAASIIINGFAFDPTAANNTVVFNDGAVGNVTTATATSLTVTFATKPTSAGSLTAVVTSSSVSSGAAVQVATVTPVVTMSTAALLANAASIIINGFGFATTPASNTVVFNDGAVGNVTAASATSLTVTFTTKPSSAGSLTAIVTANGVSSGAAVQVATVTPVVTVNTAALPADATSITIGGFGFDPTALNNTVAFNDGAVGNVTAASATSLTVTFTTKPASAGSLTAVVTTNTLSSGAAVQVATVTPVVTGNTAQIVNPPTIVINGFGFSSTPLSNTVAFNLGAAGTVTSASATQLTVTFSTQPTTAGVLTAVVTSNGVSSGAAVQVATVVSITLSALPDWTIGQNYTPVVSAAGGSGPFTFALTAGALPTGLTLNANGTFIGAPSATGAFPFTITATQSASATGSRAYTVNINSLPAVSDLTATQWTQGKAGFTGTMTISNGTPPHAILGSPTGLPTGMSLQVTGNVISFTGTPSAAGTFNGSVTIRDSAGAQVSKSFSITINPPITFALAALPSYMVGTPYRQTLNAVTGGTGAITFQYAQSGPLPSGMTLVNGVLSGTPTNATTTTITVTATDSVGAVTVKTYTLTAGLNARRRRL